MQIDISLVLSYLSAAVVALATIGVAVLGAYSVLTAIRLVTGTFNEWRQEREFNAFYDKYLHADDDDIVADYFSGKLTEQQFDDAFAIQQLGIEQDKEASDREYEAKLDKHNEDIANLAYDYFSGQINGDEFDTKLDKLHSDKESWF